MTTTVKFIKSQKPKFRLGAFVYRVSCYILFGSAISMLLQFPYAIISLMISYNRPLNIYELYWVSLSLLGIFISLAMILIVNYKKVIKVFTYILSI